MKRYFLFFGLTLFMFCFSLAQEVSHVVGLNTVSGQADGNTSVATLNNPHGFDIDENGNIYIADRYNHVIRKYATNGTMTTIAGGGIAGDLDGIGTTALFNEPWDVAIDNKGNIFVADAKNNKIKKIDSLGMVTTYAGTGSAGFKDHSSPASATFFWPSGLDFDNNYENLYIAGHLSHLVRKIDATGNVTTLAGQKVGFPNNFGTDDGVGSTAKFYRPYGLHVGSDDNIYLADEWNGLIRKITPHGVVTTLGGQGYQGYANGDTSTSEYNYPWDVTTDRYGNIYVMDGFNHVIRKINPETLESTLFAGVPGVTGSINGPVLSAKFNGATAIEYFEPTGTIFIADAFNHVIRKIDLLEVPIISLTDSCSEDKHIIASNLKYYEKYHWYVNNEYSISSDTFFTTLDIKNGDKVLLIAERSGSNITSNELSIEFSGETSPITVLGKTPACPNDTIALTTNHSSPTWNNGLTEDTLTVTQPGEYSFTANNVEGCPTISGNITIDYAESFTVSVEAENKVISSESLLLSAQGGGSWEWSTGYIGKDLEVKEEGNYWFTAYDEYGCISHSDTVFITKKTVEAIDDIISISFGETIPLSPLENDSFTSEISFNLLSTPSELDIFESEGELILTEQSTSPGEYTLKIPYSICLTENITACDTAIIYVSVKSSGKELSFPNAISPNDDGINDFFVPMNTTSGYSGELQVFNRWGQPVYTNDKYSGEWKGQNQQNAPLPDGTYFYIYLPENSNQKISGYVLVYK